MEAEAALALDMVFSLAELNDQICDSEISAAFDSSSLTDSSWTESSV